MIEPCPKSSLSLPIQVHETTLPHLDIIERAILNCLIKQGQAVIISQNNIGQRAAARGSDYYGIAFSA
jgi:hypothetical protein